MKKLSTLLAQRPALLRQARLANLASAYEALDACAERIARARLTGRVTLSAAAPEVGRYLASLVALDGRQSIIEEHFTDEALLDLADLIALARGEPTTEVTFCIEELGELFLAPLRTALEREGVVIDGRTVRNDTAG
ncbi:MAG: hypothetical protein ABIQ12_01290 [Opitutaceae bacterium]